MVQLTPSLSECVRRELKISDSTKTSFSEQELAQVSYASISRNDMDEIKYFTNLSVLEIVSFPSLTIEDLRFIGEHIPNIVSLKIKEQNAIYRLDLSSFKKLKELAVIHNDNIIDIEGIDEVTRFTFYDNREYKNIQHLVDYVMKNPDSKVTLDILYYIGFKRNSSIDVSKITWVESLGLRSFNVHEYSLEEIDFVMNYIADVVSRYIYYDDDPFMKFGVLYNWIINNIKFSNEDESKIDISYKVDTTYHVFSFREGGRLSYARALQMLLLYADVDATLVYSYGALDSVGYHNGKKVFSLFGSSDYALLRLCIKGKNYYNDIAWDSMVNNYKYADALKVFLVSKEELSLKHKIVGEGNVVNSYSYHGDDGEELIEKASARIDETNQKYSKLDDLNNKLINYRISKAMRENILDNKKKNNTFKYPGEEKVLELSIQADDSFISKFEKEKVSAIKELISYLKEKHLPDNLDGMNSVNDYLNDQKNKCNISNSLYEMLVDL